MIIAEFQVEDKVNKPKFFQKTFLVANTKFEMILKILFFKINNAIMLFDKKTLIWKFYTTNKALFIIEQVFIIDPKEFIIAALTFENEIFVMYITILK